MDNRLNAPATPEPSSPRGISEWFSIWMTAVTKRSEQTYARLAEHPDAATPNRAFLWVFLAGTVSALVSGVLQALLELAGLASPTAGMSEIFGGGQSGAAVSLGVSICFSPVAGGLGVLLFAIAVGLIQWIAKMFGGVGTFSRLAYPMAAISVPFTLLSSVLTPLSTIIYVGICTGLLSLIIGIYALVLEVTAVKGVNRFGWGQALGSFFLPTLVLLCCAIVPIGVIAVMRLLGPEIGNTFSTIGTPLP
jgi:Yip1-like protein